MSEKIELQLIAFQPGVFVTETIENFKLSFVFFKDILKITNAIIERNKCHPTFYHTYNINIVNPSFHCCLIVQTQTILQMHSRNITYVEPRRDVRGVPVKDLDSYALPDKYLLLGVVPSSSTIAGALIEYIK